MFPCTTLPTSPSPPPNPPSPAPNGGADVSVLRPPCPLRGPWGLTSRVCRQKRKGRTFHDFRVSLLRRPGSGQWERDSSPRTTNSQAGGTKKCLSCAARGTGSRSGSEHPARQALHTGGTKCLSCAARGTGSWSGNEPPAQQASHTGGRDSQAPLLRRPGRWQPERALIPPHGKLRKRAAPLLPDPCNGTGWNPQVPPGHMPLLPSQGWVSRGLFRYVPFSLSCVDVRTETSQITTFPAQVRCGGGPPRQATTPALACLLLLAELPGRTARTVVNV
ncbi:hypothetical protein CALCODRAFT_25727 [Calocera cornea HHB12733]|uniref:Uncharacterized protein n=1 Tax=Calocera cornea HHB12733 TaxID=1353952 RepID=A0A165J2T7_9BASI|nr:hypothetical protein CALCODRAFT_25727 [Calocera cornea HHB12733]